VSIIALTCLEVVVLSSTDDTARRNVRPRADPASRRGVVHPDFARTPLPVVPIEFRKGGRARSYFSTVTAPGSPQDAMLQEIRLESFFPADETTAAHYW